MRIMFTPKSLFSHIWQSGALSIVAGHQEIFQEEDFVQSVLRKIRGLFGVMQKFLSVSNEVAGRIVHTPYR